MISLAVGLAFLFGYALSTLPLLRAGLGFFSALGIVLAADTLSIATMELVDNAVMAAIPGAMDAGLSNPVFWLAMTLALTAAFITAYPVSSAWRPPARRGSPGSSGRLRPPRSSAELCCQRGPCGIRTHDTRIKSPLL